MTMNKTIATLGLIVGLGTGCASTGSMNTGSRPVLSDPTEVEKAYTASSAARSDLRTAAMIYKGILVPTIDSEGRIVDLEGVINPYVIGESLKTVYEIADKAGIKDGNITDEEAKGTLQATVARYSKRL